MNDPTQTPVRCGAKTRSGVPCAKFPMEGKRRCRLHGGLSTGPKTDAGREAISAANTKHGRYKNWREKRAKEHYYRGEIKRVIQEAREGAILILYAGRYDNKSLSEKKKRKGDRVWKVSEEK